MLPNSSGSARRPSVCTEIWKAPGCATGGWFENAGRDLNVLPLQRRHHVARRQRQRLQPIGIEPDAHRIVAAAEHRDRADALDAAQHVDRR